MKTAHEGEEELPLMEDLDIGASLVEIGKDAYHPWLQVGVSAIITIHIAF